MAVHVVALVILFASLANSQAGTQAPAFDAASVKIADKTVVPGVTFTMKGGPGTSDPGRITFTQINLWGLLTKAWGVEGYRIDGPAWLKGLVFRFSFTMRSETIPATNW